MPAREELECLPSTGLAVLCEQVANDPSVDAATAEKARQLKLECVALQTPPAPSLKEEQAKEAKRRENWKSMVDLLATI